MKAVVCKKTGGDPLTLIDAAMPVLKEREVLVKISAATVTPSDRRSAVYLGTDQ